MGLWKISTYTLNWSKHLSFNLIVFKIWISMDQTFPKILFIHIYMALSNTKQHFQAQSDGPQFSWKRNFFKIPKACFYSYNGHFRKFKFQLLGVILGAHRMPKIGCFFSKLMKLEFFCFITQLVKKLQLFICVERRYPGIRYEYKTASEWYLVTELWAKPFGAFFEKILNLNFFENPQNFFAYISPTKYRS